jgi:hypothetical protein
VKKSDFDEYEGLKLLVSKAAHYYKRSTERWVEIVEFWQEQAPKHFGEEVSFEIFDSGLRVDGVAVGQHFSIHSTIAVEEGGASLRAAVVVKDRNSDKYVELDSFLVRHNGAISSLDGEDLLERDDDLREYKLLSAVIRRVFGVTDS